MATVDFVKDVCTTEDLFSVMALARWLWSCGIDTVELATVVTIVVVMVFACGIGWIALFEVMLSAVTEPIQIVWEKDIALSFH